MTDDAAAPGLGWRETYLGGSLEAERALLTASMPRINRIQELVEAKQRATPQRAFHNKGIGVRVDFEVAPDLPGHLQAGFLARGARYEGFGRFSRSQSFRQADRTSDQRGFAFRFETPSGPQDILLSNTPISFATDPLMFLVVTTIAAESPLLVVPFRLLRALGLRRTVSVILKSRPPDPTVAFTSQRYWSRTPFAFGERAARLFVRPAGPGRRVRPTDNPDFLGVDLARELRAGPRSFELCAQLFVDDRRTPIEDAAREWRESVAPPVVMGRVILPQQELDSDAGRALAARVEAESFNPWTTPGLRPLGSMNRSRLDAYRRSAAHRGGAAVSAPLASALTPPGPDFPR